MRYFNGAGNERPLFAQPVTRELRGGVPDLHGRLFKSRGALRGRLGAHGSLRTAANPPRAYCIYSAPAKRVLSPTGT